MSAIDDEVRQAAPQFVRESERARVVSVERVGAGLIHASFRVAVEGPSEASVLLVQRVNTHVLREPDKVQANVLRVTSHQRAKLVAAGTSPERRVLVPRLTAQGESLAWGARGDVFRAFDFIARAHTVLQAPTEAHAHEAGRAFGEFATTLADLPAPPLHETIVGFHDTRARLAAMQRAYDADVCGRAVDAREETHALLQRAELVERVAGASASGALPQRVTHNDTKLDNLLFDDASEQALCVLDLDTVMPGSWLYDFGDLARSVFTSQGFRLPLLSALARGYVGAVDRWLTRGERELLWEAPRLLALELAARFLTDHLEGDHYFVTTQPGQNLVRAREQLSLVLELERHASEVRAAVTA